jgi:hypothetical protein
VDAIESLYRDSGRRHSGLRPFETALQPPEGADGYGWLYRAEQVLPTLSAEPAAAATLTSPALISKALTASGSRRRWLFPAVLAAGGACLATVMLAGLLLAGSF